MSEPRKTGSAKGAFETSADFDDPMEPTEDYTGLAKDVRAACDQLNEAIDLAENKGLRVTLSMPESITFTSGREVKFNRVSVDISRPL